MKEIFTAATIEEAKALAAGSFGVSMDKITFKVLDEVKKGLFRKPSARVQAEYDYPAPVASNESDVPPIKVMVTEDDRKASRAAKEKRLRGSRTRQPARSTTAQQDRKAFSAAVRTVFRRFLSISEVFFSMDTTISYLRTIVGRNRGSG